MILHFYHSGLKDHHLLSMVLKNAPYPLASTLGLTINSTQQLERYLENINKIMPFSA